MTFITDRQREMLTHLSGQKDGLDVIKMRTAMGLSRNGQVNENLVYNFNSLVDKGLAVVIAERSNHVGIHWGITVDGAAALRGKKPSKKATSAPVRFERISVMSQPVYDPAKHSAALNRGICRTAISRSET